MNSEEKQLIEKGDAPSEAVDQVNPITNVVTDVPSEGKGTGQKTTGDESREVRGGEGKEGAGVTGGAKDGATPTKPPVLIMPTGQQNPGQGGPPIVGFPTASTETQGSINPYYIKCCF